MVLTEVTNELQIMFDNARRVAVLTGAGISAESGVPTFRGGGDSSIWTWRGRPVTELSSAELIATNPTLVWEWFDYRRGRLLVSEAVGGTVDASSVSSYSITANGLLEVISPAVATTETAACWVVVTKNNRFAYVSNTGSGSLTAYRVARDGSITLRDADGRTGDTGTGSGPLDIAFSNNDQYIYTLNNGTHAIGAFRVQKNGGLVAIPGATGLPIGTNGLAAH